MSIGMIYMPDMGWRFYIYNAVVNNSRDSPRLDRRATQEKSVADIATDPVSQLRYGFSLEYSSTVRPPTSPLSVCTVNIPRDPYYGIITLL